MASRRLENGGNGSRNTGTFDKAVEIHICYRSVVQSTRSTPFATTITVVRIPHIGNIEQCRAASPRPGCQPYHLCLLEFNLIFEFGASITLAGIACIIMREVYATIGESIYPNPSFLSRDIPEVSGRLLRNLKEFRFQDMANRLER